MCLSRIVHSPRSPEPRHSPQCSGLVASVKNSSLLRIGAAGSERRGVGGHVSTKNLYRNSESRNPVGGEANEARFRPDRVEALRPIRLGARPRGPPVPDAERCPLTGGRPEILERCPWLPDAAVPRSPQRKTRTRANAGTRTTADGSFHYTSDPVSVVPSFAFSGWRDASHGGIGCSATVKSWKPNSFSA